MSSESNGTVPTRFSSTVKWYNTDKGYGFINRPSDCPGDKDVFLHAKVLPSGTTAIDEGTPISFEIKTDERGTKAINVALGK